jgi:hypothetical protein
MRTSEPTPHQLDKLLERILIALIAHSHRDAQRLAVADDFSNPHHHSRDLLDCGFEDATYSPEVPAYQRNA